MVKNYWHLIQNLIVTPSLERTQSPEIHKEMIDNPVSAKYLVERHCILCRGKYTELENLGRLGCRIHPGLRLCDKEGREFFSCCGFYVDASCGGNATWLAMKGCVAVDHIDDTVKLDTSDLDLRLDAIKAFALIALPTSIFRTSHHIILPRPRTIVLDFNGITGLPREPLLKHHVHTFDETRHNHALLKALHSPHKSMNLHFRPLVNNTLVDIEGTRDTLNINVHEASTRLTRTTQRSSAIRHRTHTTVTTTTLVAGTAQDRWPSVYTKRDGTIGVGQNTEEDVTTRIGKEAAPFMIIRRIDDKLEIPVSYSKLVESGGELI